MDPSLAFLMVLVTSMAAGFIAAGIVITVVSLVEARKPGNVSINKAVQLEAAVVQPVWKSEARKVKTESALVCV